MQGETDACHEEQTDMYIQLYDCFLNDFKKEFSKYLKNCTFIDGGISNKWPCWEKLNNAKKEYAQKHDDCVYIDTIAEGLTTEKEPHEGVDWMHYDSDCVIQLGHLFADNIKF